MKRILIEIDDRCARDLERVAPATTRSRATFIRHAIRMALDVALDRATEAAYGARPLPRGTAAGDLEGWDPGNELAAVPPAKRRTRRRPTKAA